LAARAARHRALGEPHRLALIDALRHTDRTPSELAEVTGLPSNLLAFHLDALEEAGLVVRGRSEGDGRRRYVRLTADARRDPSPVPPPVGDRVLFVCTHNASRSQLAAALWTQRTGVRADSAGRQPAERVDPTTVTVARDRGLDLGDATPRSYAQLDAIGTPELIISVCDRAGEADVPFVDVPRLHWSVPDPLGHGRARVEAAHDELRARIDALLRDREVAA
jgi:protein-tyrosine-phosphatase